MMNPVIGKTVEIDRLQGELILSSPVEDNYPSSIFYTIGTLEGKIGDGEYVFVDNKDLPIVQIVNNTIIPYGLFVKMENGVTLIRRGTST